MAKKSSQDVIQDILNTQVEAIDEQLAMIERKLAPYQKYIDLKQQLLSARRALLGHGPRTTGGNSTRLHLDDIIGFLKENPGSAPGAIAERFGVTQSTVSSHLYRNKGRFIQRDGCYWNRDPKEGLNTADDLDSDDDE